MNTVQRTRGIRKMIQAAVFGRKAPRYVRAGDRDCGTLMREARRQAASGPSDMAIMAWAEYDLAREMMSGFWEPQAA